jgi:hypothetical protein
MTARSAEAIVKAAVDKTMKEHFGMVCSKCALAATPDSNYCKSCEQVTKKKRKSRLCISNACTHVTSRNLDVARLVEAGTHISKTKGYIDLPGDDPELLRLTATRLRSFAETAGKAASAFHRVATVAENHARRGWLHQLAECALDVDEDHLGEE